MKPIVPTVAQAEHWGNPGQMQVVTIGGPAEGPDVTPCPALVTFPEGTDGAPVVRVAWQLDEIELTHLARGGTLWLSTWGGLPIHAIEVAPPKETWTPQPEEAS